MNCYFASLFIILLLLCGCRTEEITPQKSASTLPDQPVISTPEIIGCAGCHEGIKLDQSHNLPCTSCHSGHDNEGHIEKAHAGLIAQPAHPANMTATCGPCHPDQVRSASGSIHFNQNNEINQIRAHFGALDRLPTPNDIPVAASITTPMHLVDDMLRRRCLRCHVSSSGDAYSAVTRGTGCSACHLPFKIGRLQSHTFTRPTDQQCLSCHYGNYVGNDYYGRYEHDFNWEYRTPYTSGPRAASPRPYGVESHDLAPDIHQQRGLTCSDCHQGSGHNQPPALSCGTCHDWKPGRPVPTLRNLKISNNTLILTARSTGKEYAVPSLQHPAHQQFQNKVACQVCHAQWSFNDSTTHLLLSKIEDFEPWERLTVQSSSEIERLLEHNINSGQQELPPTMRDGLTGESRPGVWYMGYGQRRWEQILIQKDTDGIIKVFRPILDLRLSMVEANGQVPFDNLKGKDDGLRPYTPHTTGHAGLFYLDRFKHLLPPARK